MSDNLSRATLLTNLNAKLDAHRRGLRKMAETVEQGTDENARKQLRNVMLATSDICEILAELNRLVIKPDAADYDMPDFFKDLMRNSYANKNRG